MSTTLDGRSSNGSRAGSNYSQNAKNKGSIVSSSKSSINVTLPNANRGDTGFVGVSDSPVEIRGQSASKQKSEEGWSISYHPTSGTIPPVGTPKGSARLKVLNDDEVQKIVAAHIIERSWLSFRDKQMFKLLKHSVCAAEHSLAYEILRKICPKEATLLNDKSMSSRLRFRFGGSEFPPMIFFKIYSNVSEGSSVKYVSGKKMIRPASEAARDACDIMGNRKFYEQMIQDMMQHEKHGITSESDITTLKDYMQYVSLLDETPAYMGGRDNSWRKLTLEVLPRQTVFYDMMDFLYNSHMSPTLQEHLPQLMSRPVTQDIQLEHMNIIALSRPLLPVTAPSRSKLTSSLQTSSRRSRQARLRAVKMKKMYGFQKEGTDLTLEKEATFATTVSQVRIEDVPEILGGDDWEQEADKLYEWTQELSFEDLATTPRMQSTM